MNLVYVLKGREADYVSSGDDAIIGINQETFDKVLKSLQDGEHENIYLSRVMSGQHGGDNVYRAGQFIITYKPNDNALFIERFVIPSADNLSAKLSDLINKLGLPFPEEG